MRFHPLAAPLLLSLLSACSGAGTDSAGSNSAPAQGQKKAAAPVPVQVRKTPD